MNKFIPIELPLIREVAMAMAVEREEWAVQARERDLYGSAREYDLTAQLLRCLAERLPSEKAA